MPHAAPILSPELDYTAYNRNEMVAALRTGPMDLQELASEIDATKETVGRTTRRHKEQFIVLDGGKVALRERGV